MKLNLPFIYNLSLILLFLTITGSIFAQISMNDSTVQIIGYWNFNEKYTYKVSNQEFKIEGTDTTDRKYDSYKVDITIIDSTSDSYIIDWFYYDHQNSTEDEFEKKLFSMAEDTKIRIKTDEMGSFKEVVNWKEISELLNKAAATFKEEYADEPNIDKIIEQVLVMFSSKEAIEAGAIEEMHQFYAFHGGKYKLGEEVTGGIKLPNLYGGEPFDAEVFVWLDEINYEDNNSIIRMKQSINSEQFTQASYDYLAKVAASMGVPAPNREEYPQVKTDIWTSSRIHGSGWVIYSVETKEVTTEDVVNVEERVIEME